MKEIIFYNHNASYYRVEYSVEVHQLIDKEFTKKYEDGSTFPFYTLTKDSLLVFRGYTDFLVKLFILNGYLIKFDSPEFENKGTIQLTDKWKSILDTDFRVVDGKNQYEYITELLKYRRASASIYTGYGKTEVQLSIVDSYLEHNPDKNAVIFVSATSIKDEFVSRSEKHNAHNIPRYHDPTCRLMLVNPKALKTSNNWNNPDFTTFFANVGCVVVDECHFLNASSYRELFEYKILNYEYVYSFSATFDKENGEIPTIQSDFKSFSPSLACVLSYSGIPRLVIKNEVDIKVTYLRANFSYVPDAVANSKMAYTMSLNIFFSSKELPKIIARLLVENPGRKMYIPVHKALSGEKLRHSIISELDALDYKTTDETVFFWKSGIVVPKSDNPKQSMRDSPDFRVLVSTSSTFEGFDLDILDTVFSAIGSSNRLSVQPAGRATRSKAPWIILPWDTGKNSIINSITKKKYAMLKAEYPNLKFDTVHM